MKFIKGSSLLLVATLSITSLAGSPLPGFPSKTTPQTLAPMLKQIMPAVVNISVIGEFTSIQTDESSIPTGVVSRPFKAVGSGVIIDAKNGYVVTNAHVISDARMMSVILGDGRHLRAKKVGADSESDIAVLQIPAEHLTALTVANSDLVEVGDFVTAIGNPFGLHHTVTSGVVSALHRNDLHLEGYEDFIQTDAPINPGNSGGALVNLQGQLVGINTALFGPAGNHGNVGIGFAIPTNMMMSIVSQLIHSGKVSRGLIGVMVQKLTPALADAFHLPEGQGAIITQVQPNSPADEAGLKAKDLILKVNGRSINSASELRNITGLNPIGTSIKLDVRRGNDTLSKTLSITSREEMAQHLREQSLFSGVQLRSIDDLTPNNEHVHGVVIGAIDYTSDAWLAGLRPGDVIVTVNDQPLSSVEDILKVSKEAKELLLEIYRNQGTFFIALKAS